MRLISPLFRLLLISTLSTLPLGARDRIFVPVSVNGQTMRFGLDTGAGVPILVWRDVADWIGLKCTPSPQPLSGDNGVIPFAVTEPATVAFFGRTFPAAPLPVTSIPPYAKWEMQGLLGWPAIRDNLWYFDLARGHLGMIDQLPADLSHWIKWRVVKTADTLILEVPESASSPGGSILIDTGSSDGVSLGSGLWQSWRAAHPDAPLTYSGTQMIPAYYVLPMTAADEWSIGGLTLRNVMLGEATPYESTVSGPHYLATFGYRALRRLRLIVDARNGFAYVQPVDPPPPFEPYNRLGAVYVPSPKNDQVTLRVPARTPAARAGLADGDELLKLGGVDLSHWQHRPGAWPQVELTSQPPGTVLDLTVRRGSRRLTFHPALEEILPIGNRPREFGSAAEAILPEFHFLPPSAALVRKAEELHLPITTANHDASDAPVLRLGDKATVLVTVVDDRDVRQWLVLLLDNGLKPGEEKPRPTIHQFTTTGHDLAYERHPVGIAIRSVGPIRGADARDLKDQWSGAIVSQEFLLLGFDSVATTMRKLAQQPFNFGAGSNPFPADVGNGPKAVPANFTLEDERAFVGGTMALAEFLQVASQTPGVRDVLRELLDLSWRDYLHSPNIGINFDTAVSDDSPEWWGVPRDATCRILTFRLSLNGQPKLLCRAVVTRPSGPLATVAGIVGLAVGRVDASGPHVMVRLLGTQRTP